MLARSEIFVENTNGWLHLNIPINYPNNDLKPTHITVVMSSEYRGDYFEGAEGSVLEAQNVVLNY